MPRRNKRVKHTPFHLVDHTAGKRRYGSQHEAERAAEIQMLTDPQLTLYVYRSPEDKGWYLTRTQPHSH